MCGSPQNEMGWKNLIAEYARHGSVWGQKYLSDVQEHHGWLLDYHIVGTRLLKKVPVITGMPGMKVIDKAVVEITKTKPAPVKRAVAKKAKLATT